MSGKNDSIIYIKIQTYLTWMATAVKHISLQRRRLSPRISAAEPQGYHYYESLSPSLWGYWTVFFCSRGKQYDYIHTSETFSHTFPYRSGVLLSNSWLKFNKLLYCSRMLGECIAEQWCIMMALLYGRATPLLDEIQLRQHMVTHSDTPNAFLSPLMTSGVRVIKERTVLKHKGD